MDFYSKNKNTSSSMENQDPIPSFNISNMLSSLLGKNNPSAQPLDNSPPPPNAPPKQPINVKPPLQNKMLSVMTSHDEFIKRVKK